MDSFKDENILLGDELVDGAIIVDEEKDIINNNSNNYSPISKIKDSSPNILDKEAHKRYNGGDYGSSSFQGEFDNKSEHSSLNNNNNNNNNNRNNNNNNDNINSEDKEVINNNSGSSSVENNNQGNNNSNNSYMNSSNINENNNSNNDSNNNLNSHTDNNKELYSVNTPKKIQKKKKKKSQNFESISVNHNSQYRNNSIQQNNPEQLQPQQQAENSFSKSTSINSEPNKKNKVIINNNIESTDNNINSNNTSFIPFTNSTRSMELSDPVSDQSNNNENSIDNNRNSIDNNSIDNNNNIDNNSDILDSNSNNDNSTLNSLENSQKLKSEKTNTTTTTTTTTTTADTSPNNNQKEENISTKSDSNIKVEYRNEPEEYNRKEFYQYRDDHRENGEHGEPTIKSEEELNKNYNDFNEAKRLKGLSYWLYFKFLFNKNKYKWDINKNKNFYLAAQIITRFGFLSKTILYCSLGVLSLAAAVDKERAVQGPDGVFEELQEMFSGGVIFLLLLGLWSYGCWGIFYIVFDVDQLGHKGAGPILKRFGRIFSSGFYFVLGVDAARVLAHTRKQESGTSHILSFLYKYIFGKIIICVLGVTFFVVALVYLIYFIKPDKFKRELSTERMNKYLYWAALGFARIGAVGRSMFFGAFGGVLIKAVADINKGKEADTSLLGFQGVFQQIANYNTTLLFIIAILIMFYALWCFWLMFFRRLPAHQDAKYAREVLGSAIDKKYVFNGILFRILRNSEDGENDEDVNHLSEFNEHHANDAMSPSIPKNVPYKQNVATDSQSHLDSENTFNYYVENQKPIPSTIDKTYNI